MRPCRPTLLSVRACRLLASFPSLPCPAHRGCLLRCATPTGSGAWGCLHRQRPSASRRHLTMDAADRGSCFSTVCQVVHAYACAHASDRKEAGERRLRLPVNRSNCTNCTQSACPMHPLLNLVLQLLPATLIIALNGGVGMGGMLDATMRLVGPICIWTMRLGRGSVGNGSGRLPSL